MLSRKRLILWIVIAGLGVAILWMASGWLTTLIGSAALVGSLIFLFLQLDQSHRQLQELGRLQAAYDQLDQQAKLIIRTDVELHRTQEELDRRLASLMSLHQLGQQLRVNLRPEEILSKIDATVVTNFGFAKGLIGTCATTEAIEWRSQIGVSQAVAEQLKRHLVSTKLLKHILTHPRPTMIYAASATEPAWQTIFSVLEVPTLLVAGVMPHAGPAGCVLLGRTAAGATHAKLEEELVAILTNQLAIAVENSALYEETWAAQRVLEQKVQERTQELAQANEELQGVNKAKSDFVSAVSHELRTPLAAIKGYAALLRTGQFGKLALAQAERIAKIEKHSDLLTQLINNLLDIARIESGRVTMEQRTINLEEFLATVHELLRPQLEEKRIQYAVDQDGVTELFGDAQHLQRVFVNLLSNAVKYTPEGGTVRLGIQREGPVILATVSDTGCGIPGGDLPKLFQEFYRSSDPINQQVRGTGLGLALVKRIVEAHQGSITVTSEHHHGSTFTVRLPAG